MQLGNKEGSVPGSTVIVGCCLLQSIAVVMLLYRFAEAGFFSAATSLAMDASKSSSSSLESSDASFSWGGYSLSPY